MAEEWGPWIEHDGKGLPTFIQGWLVQARCERWPGHYVVAEGIAGSLGGKSWDWRNWLKMSEDGNRIARVIAYRIRRPLALRRLIDLAADPEKGLPPRFPVEELA